MITVSKKDRYVGIWGAPTQADITSALEYRAQGYTVVLLHNGTEDIKNSIRTVVRSTAT